jgi:hypothetical protein
MEIILTLFKKLLMNRLLVLLLLIVAFSACKNTWNEDDKKSFYEACEEDARSNGAAPDKIKPYCDCVFGKIMAKYPNENDALEHMDSLAKDADLMSCKTERMK